MGKYLKLAEKVVTQDTSPTEGRYDKNDRNDKTLPPTESENNLSVSESRELGNDIYDKNDKRFTGVDTSHTPVAARIYSRTLCEDVWVVTHREAVAFVPEGAVVYLPEEIRNLKGATEEEIRAVHRAKKEIGGALIAVNDKRGRT